VTNGNSRTEEIWRLIDAANLEVAAVWLLNQPGRQRFRQRYVCAGTGSKPPDVPFFGTGSKNNDGVSKEVSSGPLSGGKKYKRYPWQKH
jgi:hypothetical protein